MNQVIFYKEKNKEVFIRIMTKKENKIVIHYRAYFTSIIVESKENEELDNAIDNTIDIIKEYIKGKENRIKDKKRKALEWIIEELLKKKQPTLF